MNKITLTLISTIFLLSANSFTQTTFTQIRKISNIGSGDNFGWKVDIDGDYAIAANYHKNATDRGEVYVYHRHSGGYNNWGAVDTLRPATLINNSWFGTSLAISGTRIMVVAKSSALIPSGDNGMAYIFEPDPLNCNQWVETGQIISPTGSSGQYLGILNADLDGDIAVLGNFSFPAFQGLAAQIYSRNQGGTNNWGRVTTITSSDYDGGDGFSWDVNLSGDDLIVGAYLANNPGSRNGAAYIFNRNQGGINNWGQVRKLVASDGAFDDDFGITVAIDGDIAVVGAQADDNGNGTDAGSAYVYSRNQGGANNWGQVRKIIGSNTAAGDLFGQDVAVYNDLILVGNNQNRTDCYLFQQNFGGVNNWGQTQIIPASAAPGANWYGHDGAITDGAIIIGDPNDNSQSGAIYFHRSILVDTPSVCNNSTNENLNNIFSPFNSTLWIGPGVFNDSLLNATGLVGLIEYIAVTGSSPCDSVRRHINFDTANDASFTTSDFCSNVGHSVTITGNNGGTFSFSPSPSDGAIINTSTGIITNFTVGNSYSIKYRVGINCPDSLTQTVTVLNSTSTNVFDTICQGDSLLFNSIYIKNSGIYTDTLLSSSGCDSIINLDLFVNSVVNDASFTTNDFCSITGHSVTITGTTGGIFSFDPTPSDGAVINSTTGEITGFTVGNSYSIKYHVGNNCSDSLTQTVTALNATITNLNDTICLGDSILFDNVYISNTGTFSDTLIASSGCDSIINLILTIDSTQPIITCLSNQIDTVESEDCNYTVLDYTSVVNITSPTLCNTSNYAITQTPAAGTVIQITNNSVTIPVEISAIYSAISDTITCNFIVDVICEKPLIIPEFISPNGDGANDTWFIKGLEKFDLNKVKIFNRYGTLIYAIDNYANDWQGEINSNESLATIRSNSKLIPSGTYFYILELPNEDLIYTGMIQVMK